MKTFLNSMLLGLALVASGCAGKDSGNPATTPDQNNWGYGQCTTPGQVPTQYGCMPQAHCPPGQALYNNQCIPAQYPNVGGGQYPSGLRFAATLNISNRDQFERFLEQMSYGQCRDSNGWIYGSYRCKNYSTQGYVIISGPLSGISNGTPLQVIVGGGARQPIGSGGYGYHYNYTVPLEVRLNGYYYPTNNNTGFAIQQQSQFGFPQGRFRARVDVGSLNNQSFSVVLEFDNVEFARTTVQRW